jgi:hypothetical protein
MLADYNVWLKNCQQQARPRPIHAKTLIMYVPWQ